MSRHFIYGSINLTSLWLLLHPEMSDFCFLSHLWRGLLLACSLVLLLSRCWQPHLLPSSMFVSFSVLHALEIKEHKWHLKSHSCNIDIPLHPLGFTRNYIPVYLICWSLLILIVKDIKSYFNTCITHRFNKGQIVSYTQRTYLLVCNCVKRGN